MAGSSSTNVVMLMAFTKASPPSGMKGEKRLAYMEERAWFSGDHIDYAGRTGKYADKAESHDEQFAQLPTHGNFMDYVSRQGTFAGKGEAGGHAPSGTGVFGRHGAIEGKALENLRAELKKTKSIIWHGVISPRKEVGDKLLADKAAAMEFMNANFDRFLNMTHLKAKNVEWYAGWHDDSTSGIKHIQFAFWEKAPHPNAKGGKSYTRVGSIRKQALADGLELFEEYFSGHQHDVHIVRDNLSKYLKQASPKEVKREIANDLIALAKVLPKVRGRAGYNHPDYAPYRKQIDAIALKMVRDVPAVRMRYQAVMTRVAEREARYRAVAAGMTNMQPSADKIAELRADIQARLGNSVIGMARRFAYDEKTVEWAKYREEQDYLRQNQLKRRAKQQQERERKRNFKRIARMFDAWYSSEGQEVLEYYEEIENIQTSRKDRSVVKQ